MIPVLGVPVLNRPDLLDEMLATVDVEVGRLIVIDNGDVVGDIPKAEVIRPGHNLGVAASWNRIMAEVPEAPWWAIIGFDITFSPGDLARLAQTMNDATTATLALLGTFSVFGINQATIDLVGRFDENFHPAYFEDNDYDYRCQLAGVPITGLPSGLLHRVSSTIQSSPVYSRENSRTFPWNHAYYQEKWGGSPRGERFASPFNRGGGPADWELDQDRIADLAWDRG